MSFTELGLAEPIIKAVAEQGYDKPSPIQAESIPAVLSGQDVMAAAQTGTGKTAGFTLPILHMLAKGKPARANQARALVLTPTRELAAQVGASVEKYGQHLPLRSTVVFGGVKINPQMMKLRRGVDVLVATPGRLLDLYNQRAVKFDELEILVLDEADRMLDMGFIHDIKKILRALPSNRQNLMFSATFSDDIRNLAKGLVNNPIEISVTPRNATANTVEQWVYPVDKNQKSNVLTKLIKDNQWSQVLVFSRTKHGANRLAKQLTGRGIDSAAIHGNKSQGARTKALADFKSNKIQVLVATDIAARGLDIDQLPHVVNFDLPNVPEDYVHRIGRTGRAGASGEAVSLVCAEEFKLLSDIERLTQKIIERKEIEGFEAIERLPESRLGKPVRAKKPKQARQGHQDGQRSGENARGHKPTGKNRRHTGGRDGNSEGNGGGNNQSQRRRPANRSGGNSSGNTASGNRGNSSGRSSGGNSGGNGQRSGNR